MAGATSGTLAPIQLPMPRLDLVTRTFWRVTGRPVDLDGSEAWLTAPMHDGQTIGDGWLQAAATAQGGTVLRARGGGGPAPRHDGAGRGHLPRRGPPAGGPPLLRAHLRVAHGGLTQWNPLFAPGGDLISRFGRRVQQLALPTRPLDVARGMDSRVVSIRDADGRQRAAGWIRTLRSTGEYVYSGCYSSRTLPGSDQPSVHVAFPLEAGNVQVLLRPRALPDGSLELSSPPGAFGEDGAYVVVADRGGHHAARAPIHEEFRVYVDSDGVLRTDHLLRLWSATVVRLHYKLTRAPG